MKHHPDSRAEVLALLHGQRPARVPCFSGLISVTAPGLESLGWRFSEVHADADKMARAAETTYRLFGFESAVVPLDLCVEAQALGARVDFRPGTPHPEFPMVSAPLAAAPEALELHLPSDFVERGRLPVVLEAIRLLKARVGGEVVVGAWVPGPFTLAMYLTEMSAMLTSVVDSPDSVGRVLDALTEAVAEVARAYREAGADFLTIHEMGGSPGYLGPGSFKKLVLPRLKRLMSAIRPSSAPCVLSVCGNTNRALPLLAEAGADALSVDQLNDVARSRAALGPGALLFGNIDPIGTLANGAESDVRQAVAKAIEAGVDAIWPGCDLWPPVPAANMRALVEAAREAARRGQSG